jgi:predicted enzyme related to lactoylglutathione lyase
MSRIQLALNVEDLDAAVEFYSKLFATEPAKRRPGYANFAVAEPPLKLVLIEGGGDPGTINHLGVEVFSTDEVAEAASRLQAAGLVTEAEHQTTCCYAVQDKVWVSGPDTSRWEVYTVLADASEEASLGCASDACVTASVAHDSAHTSASTRVTTASSCC